MWFLCFVGEVLFFEFRVGNVLNGKTVNWNQETWDEDVKVTRAE
jgi:hypothetical protein